MTQQPQVFNLADLSGDDIQAIMNGLNELPSKVSRHTLNKVEQQLVAQIQRQQQANQLKATPRTHADGEPVKAGLND